MDNQEKTINAAMVVLARESRGLTQQELAERLGIAQGTLSRIESGVRGASEALLQRISEVLDYPTEFFFQTDPVYGFGPSELFHRKRRNVPTHILNMVRAQTNIRRMNLARMLRSLDIGPLAIKSLDLDGFGGKPEEVARAVRAMWHLPEHGPIPNLTKAIEEAGGIIIPFDFGTRQVDAISQWPPGMPPLIFVDTGRFPWDRLRFTLVHELGHLVMHHEYTDATAEAQADAFAAEFLMPAKDIRPYLFDLTLAKLASLKPYWKVSMAALIKRATDLSAIAPRHARTLWTEMAKAGYKTREPDALDIPSETLTLYDEVIRAYREHGKYGPKELAKVLTISEHDVRRIYFSMTSHLRVVG